MTSCVVFNRTDGKDPLE